MNNTTTLNPKSQRQIQARVFLLDDSVHTFSINSYAIGSELFNAVIHKQGILEADYFDLEFVNCEGIRCWLDHDKSIVRQVGLGKDMIFIFAVKFYTPHPNLLEEEYTRYLFALQIKRDLVSGHLICSPNTAALLASYIVQAEIGDFLEDEYVDCAYLRPLKILNQPNDEILNKVMEFHKNHIGITPSEADFHLLDTARKIEYYGVKMHLAKDHENLPLNLSVTHMGIVVFQNLTKINTFSWAKIRKLSFKRKKFLVKLHPEGYGYYKGMVEFYFETRDDCKRFWKKCIEHHAFFRCPATEKSNRKKPKVVTKGSSFRYSGKTQKELMDFVRENYTTRRDNFIRPSKARVSKSPHNPKSARNHTTKSGAQSFLLKGSYSVPSRAVSDGNDLHKTGTKSSSRKHTIHHSNTISGHNIAATSSSNQKISSRSNERISSSRTSNNHNMEDDTGTVSMTTSPHSNRIGNSSMTTSPHANGVRTNPIAGTSSTTPSKRQQQQHRHHHHRASNPSMNSSDSRKQSSSSLSRRHQQQQQQHTAAVVDHQPPAPHVSLGTAASSLPASAGGGQYQQHHHQHQQKRTRKGRKFIQVSHTGSSAEEDDDKRVTASEMSLSSSSCWWGNTTTNNDDDDENDNAAGGGGDIETRSSSRKHYALGRGKSESGRELDVCEQEPLPAREAFESTSVKIPQPHKDTSDKMAAMANCAIASARMAALQPQRASVGGIGDISEDNQSSRALTPNNVAKSVPPSQPSTMPTKNSRSSYIEDHQLLEQPLGIQADKAEQQKHQMERDKQAQTELNHQQDHHHEHQQQQQQMSAEIPYVLLRRHKSQSGASSLKSGSISHTKKHASKSLKNVRDAVDGANNHTMNHPYSVSTITSGIMATNKIRHSKSLDRRLANAVTSDSSSNVIQPKSPKLLREQYMHNQRKNILSDKETIEALKTQLRNYGSNKSLSRPHTSYTMDMPHHYATMTTNSSNIHSNPTVANQQNGPMFVSAYRLPPINNFSAKDDTISPGNVNNDKFDKFYDRITKLAAENQKKRRQMQQAAINNSNSKKQASEQANGANGNRKVKKNVVDVDEETSTSKKEESGTGDLDSLLDLIPGNPIYLDSSSSSSDDHGDFSLDDRSSHRRRPRSVSESEYRLRTPKSSRRSSLCRGANSSLSLTDDEGDDTSFNGDSFDDDEDDKGSAYSFLDDNKDEDSAKNEDGSLGGCLPLSQLTNDNKDEAGSKEEKKEEARRIKIDSTNNDDHEAGLAMDLQVLEIPKLSSDSSDSPRSSSDIEVIQREDAISPQQLNTDKDNVQNDELVNQEEHADSQGEYPEKEDNQTQSSPSTTTTNMVTTSLVNCKQFSIRSEEDSSRENSPERKSIPETQKEEDEAVEQQSNDEILLDKKEVIEPDEDDEEEETEEEEEGEEYNANNLLNTLLPLDSIPEVAQEDKANTSTTNTTSSPYSSKRSSQLATDEWDSCATPHATSTPTIDLPPENSPVGEDDEDPAKETESDIEQKRNVVITLENLFRKRTANKKNVNAAKSSGSTNNPFIRCSTPKSDRENDSAVVMPTSTFSANKSSSENDVSREMPNKIYDAEDENVPKSSSLTPSNPPASSASSSSTSSDAVKTVQSIISSPYKQAIKSGSLRRPYQTSSSSSSSSSSSTSSSSSSLCRDDTGAVVKKNTHAPSNNSSGNMAPPPDIIQISAHPQDKSENINLSSTAGKATSGKRGSIQDNLERSLMYPDTTDSESAEKEATGTKETRKASSTSSGSGSGSSAGTTKIRRSAEEMVEGAISRAQVQIHEDESAEETVVMKTHEEQQEEEEEEDEYVLPGSITQTPSSSSSNSAREEEDENPLTKSGESADEVIQHSEREDADSFPPPPPREDNEDNETRDNEEHIGTGTSQANGHQSPHSNSSSSSSSTSSSDSEGSQEIEPFPPPPPPPPAPQNGTSGGEENPLSDSHLHRNQPQSSGTMPVFDEREEEGEENEDEREDNHDDDDETLSGKYSPPDLLTDTAMPRIPDPPPSPPPSQIGITASGSTEIDEMPPFPQEQDQQHQTNVEDARTSESTTEQMISDFVEQVDQYVEQQFLNLDDNDFHQNREEVCEEIIEEAIVPENVGLLEDKPDEVDNTEECRRISYEDIYPDAKES